MSMDCDLDFVTDIDSSRISDSVGEEEISHGFRWRIETKTANSAFGHVYRISLHAEPCDGCDGYRLLCDFRLSLSNPKKNLQSSNASVHVQYELIGEDVQHENERALQVYHDDLRHQFAEDNEDDFKFSVRVQVKVREMLPCHVEDYKTENDQRDFAILVENDAFYVNLQYLTSLGSSYFDNLLKSKQRGVRRTVLFAVTSKQFESFLDALCTYRKPVVTNRNFELVLNLASQFIVEAALRACETYLRECDNIHVVRKLEYAAEYGLGLLGENIARQLHDGKLYAHLDALHSYMQMNDEQLTQQHPDVLRALSVFDDFVVY